MRFLADVNVELPIIHSLRRRGHDVLRAYDVAPTASDEEILAMAFAQQRIVLTNDTDFGGLVEKIRCPAHGVVLMRLHALSRREKAVQTLNAIETHERDLTGNHCVIEPGRIRIRPLPK
jgi:predicted nuclease of predicted toxin-antitoxin system